MYDRQLLECLNHEYAQRHDFKSKKKQQGSGIDTIKYHTCPRIPNGKVTKLQLNITNKSQEVSPFQAGDHKAAMNRRESMTNTDINNTNDPQQKYITVYYVVIFNSSENSIESD